MFFCTSHIAQALHPASLVMQSSGLISMEFFVDAFLFCFLILLSYYLFFFSISLAER
jgi:hypothetical protein